MLDTNIMKADTEIDDVNVEDIVEQYFEKATDESQLEIFVAKNLSEMCRRLVLSDNKDTDSMDQIIKSVEVIFQKK